MKHYKVTYSGNATRYQGFEDNVYANSEREAVEKVYKQVMDANYFPQDDGSILDCDGHEVATATDTVIEYDGGQFSASEYVTIEAQRYPSNVHITFRTEEEIVFSREISTDGYCGDGEDDYDMQEQLQEAAEGLVEEARELFISHIHPVDVRYYPIEQDQWDRLLDTFKAALEHKYVITEE